jgi:hypothetical protein
MRHQSILTIASLAAAFVVGGGRSKADLVTIPATVQIYNPTSFAVLPFPTELGTLEGVSLFLSLNGPTTEEWGDPAEFHDFYVAYGSSLPEWLIMQEFLGDGSPNDGSGVDFHRHFFSRSVEMEWNFPAALTVFETFPVQFNVVSDGSGSGSHTHTMSWPNANLFVDAHFVYSAVPEARSWLAMGVIALSVIGTSIFRRRRIQQGIGKPVCSAFD